MFAKQGFKIVFIPRNVSVSNLLLVSKKTGSPLVHVIHLCVGQSGSHAKDMLSFWSKNQFGIKIYVCRMVWGLVGYGCRLAVLAHGFGVGHSGLRQPKVAKSRVTKKWSFSGHGPTPKILTFFFGVCISVG